MRRQKHQFEWLQRSDGYRTYVCIVCRLSTDYPETERGLCSMLPDMAESAA